MSVAEVSLLVAVLIFTYWVSMDYLWKVDSPERVAWGEAAAVALSSGAFFATGALVFG